MLENGRMEQAPVQAVALFSGGLDSILAARLILDQGIRVRCLHFVSPFFGKPLMLPHWREVYGLDIESVDVSEEYIRMLRDRPAHGFGKVMNPCVDCKILMMQNAKRRMIELGASFIISGEVLGQRPMSQRRDTLNVIRRDGDVRDILLRPLSALHLEPTEVERKGLVERSQLKGFFGRGRKGQLELAQQMGIREIPTPAGGCKLAEKENARRYWPVLTRLPNPTVEDFELSNVGRQGWSQHIWLSIGRNEADNTTIARLVRKGDILVKVLDVPGPLAIIRPLDAVENAALEADIFKASAFVAACAPKAARLGGSVQVRLTQDNASRIIEVTPKRTEDFTPPPFDEIRSPIHTPAEASDGQGTSS